MSAAVPAAWLDGVVKAAIAIAGGQSIAAGAVSAAAVAFSDTMVRSLFMTKLKLAATALLAAGGAAFVVALAAGSDDGGMPKDRPTAFDRASVTAVAAKAAAPKADEKTRPVPVTGRILDPDGRPVAGARLYVTQPHNPFRDPPPPLAVRATTGADGRFSFEVHS